MEQRSQEGLFRSLLHEILRAHPSFIALVFPEEWRHCCELAANNVQITLNVWTLPKLFKAFQRLIDQASTNLKFCFFIDGFDEYEGDHESLAQFFLNLSSKPLVKVCISSRPWPIFKEIFKGRPQLKLQDLTYSDIHRYVETSLCKNHRMVALIAKEPERATKLVDIVTTKADGVFLWVTLVVKSLIKGLHNQDSVEILEKRVGIIPRDLKSLYRHMVTTIEPLYMEEASRLIQLCQAVDINDSGRKGIELIYHALTLSADLKEAMVPIGTTLPGQMSVADAPGSITKKNNNSSLDQTVATSKDKFDVIVSKLDPVLQSRCGGLIEISLPRIDDYGGWYANLSYIHATVPEFIEELQTSGEIAPPPASWNPHTALLAATVLCVKHYIPHHDDECMRYIEGLWVRALMFAFGGQSFDDKWAMVLLAEFTRGARDLC